MRHFLPGDLVAAQREAEASMGPSQPPSSLDELVTDGGRFLEDPESGAFGGCRAVGPSDDHLKFAIQVMSKHCRQEVQLVARESTGGHIVQVALALQLGEHISLACPTVVKEKDRLRFPAFVGHDDLELIAFLVWGEQSQLHRLLGLFFHPMAQKQESVAMLPTLGCPVALEVVPLRVQTFPPS